MWRGGRLPSVDIAYESWGRPNDSADNVVLLFTGLSPSAHAASHEGDPSPGWWEFMVGAGRPVDTDQWHVICVNSLGSCFGSTGPASRHPETGRPYQVDFPEVSVEDIAAGGMAALRALGFERAHTVIGSSLGGMSALAFALRYPEALDELVTISAAVHATPFAIAIRSMQRDMVCSDPAWQGGRYEPGHGPSEGMRLARKLGLTSYRSPAEWQHRFGRERVPADKPREKPFSMDFQVEAYLEFNARKFAGSFDPNCYLYLSRAMDLFDAADHGRGSLKQAFRQLQIRRNLVIGVESDFLFPLEQQAELADCLRGAGLATEYLPLPSTQGHDSFLIDKDHFAPALRAFMAGERPSGATRGGAT